MAIALLYGLAGACSPSSRAPVAKRSQATLESILRASAPAQADFSALNKIDSPLQSLLAAYLSAGDIAQMSRSLGMHLSGEKDVLVDVYVTSSVTEAAAQLSRLGMDVRATNEGSSVVEGALPVDQLLAAAGLDATRAIIAVTAFGTNKTP
jgi:hypothetical protein